MLIVYAKETKLDGENNRRNRIMLTVRLSKRKLGRQIDEVKNCSAG
jgi:hypothetical protein